MTNINRKENYLKLYSHAWYHKLASRLNAQEEQECLQFIEANKNLNKSDFEHTLNRFFVDRKDKPKNWKIMLELLCCSNQ